MTVARRLVPLLLVVAAIVGIVAGLRLYAFFAGG